MIDLVELLHKILVLSAYERPTVSAVEKSTWLHDRKVKSKLCLRLTERKSYALHALVEFYRETGANCTKPASCKILSNIVLPLVNN
jgi:hypothetical protein